jgi:uncharacterized protein YbjQ (UPF0145 family)
MEYDRPFEETRQMASDVLEGMEERLAEMTKEYEEMTERGEAEAAAELKERMDALEQEICFETDAFRMTFY